MSLTIVYAIIGLVVVFGAYNIYASLIQKKNKVRGSFCKYRCAIKKRYDLLPNILTIAQKNIWNTKEVF